MDLSTVYERLHNLTQSRIVKSDIARTLDVDPAQLRRKEVAKTDLKLDELKLIADAFNLPIKLLINPEYNNENIISQTKKINEMLNPTVTLDYFPDIEVSCGNGIIPFGETKEKITVPVNLIRGYSKNNKYVIVSATSDSMQPEIKPNDMLIIRVTDTDTIIDNHIYVFCYEDRLYCKYLSYNVNQIIVRSANKDYPTRFIEKENINDFRLCGEVCGHFRSYNLK